jgi:hypothetical protein
VQIRNSSTAVPVGNTSSLKISLSSPICNCGNPNLAIGIGISGGSVGKENWTKLFGNNYVLNLLCFGVPQSYNSLVEVNVTPL